MIVMTNCNYPYEGFKESCQQYEAWAKELMEKYIHDERKYAFYYLNMYFSEVLQSMGAMPFSKIPKQPFEEYLLEHYQSESEIVKMLNEMT